MSCRSLIRLLTHRLRDWLTLLVLLLFLNLQRITYPLLRGLLNSLTLGQDLVFLLKFSSKLVNLVLHGLVIVLYIRLDELIRLRVLKHSR